MTVAYGVGERSIAESSQDVVGLSDTTFDWFRTVISQYANSPVLLKLIENMNTCLDPTANFDAFYRAIWNIDSAQDHGLDVWGRIVGVGRVLHLPVAGKSFAFKQQNAQRPFGSSVFASGGTATTNFALSDAAYRKLIFAKALANISDGSIASINQILVNLFSSYGNCYVIDNRDMTLTYRFGGALTPVDLAIVSQSGVLPKPTGVSATIVQG